jgi:hypothetical protein
LFNETKKEILSNENVKNYNDVSIKTKKDMLKRNVLHDRQLKKQIKQKVFSLPICPTKYGLL